MADYCDEGIGKVSRNFWQQYSRRIKIVGAFFLGVVTLGAGLVAIIQFLESRQSFDLNGEWKIVNTIKSTSYSSYRGLRIGYRIFIHQQGNNVSAEGERWWQNEQEITSTAHSPIHITGSIQGNNIIATFVEEGARRKTSGKFVWRIVDNDNMVGEFTHTAANAKGPSVATRVY